MIFSRFMTTPGLNVEVTPQKKKVIEQFFLTFLKYTLAMSVSKNIIKRIGHCACLGDIME